MHDCLGASLYRCVRFLGAFLMAGLISGGWTKATSAVTATGRTIAQLRMFRLVLDDYVAEHGAPPGERQADGTTWGFWLLWGDSGRGVLSSRSLEHQLVSAADPSLASHPRDVQILDAFGNPFSYRVGADGSVTVYSWGPNGVDEGGGGDDLTPDHPYPPEPGARAGYLVDLAILLVACALAAVIVWCVVASCGTREK